MFGNLRWPELVVLLMIVILIFGVGRIGKVAGELGKGIRAFKDGINGVETKEGHDDDGEESDQDEK